MTSKQGRSLASLMRATGARTATISLNTKAYGHPPGGVYVVLVMPDTKPRHEVIPADGER